MTRELHDHRGNALNDSLVVERADEPGPGGAFHHYTIRQPGVFAGAPWSGFHDIFFQNGPIQEAGINGITHEALLAIVIDRLRAFQAGPYACHENASALTKLEEGLMWLNERTRKRTRRGVEGTMQK